ncbi:MAG: hypothetical protein KAS89_09820 [Candidatus Eisenbacteria sp.]|nr:hypothetical protein [Candidatus Eisenbacteria bacterium]
MDVVKRCCLGVLALSAAVCLASCATYAPVADISSQSDELSAGDRVRVTTADGEQTSFTLKEITEDALVGAHKRIALSDVASVELEDPTTWMTVVLVLGGIIGIATIGMLVDAAIGREIL